MFYAQTLRTNIGLDYFPVVIFGRILKVVAYHSSPGQSESVCEKYMQMPILTRGRRRAPDPCSRSRLQFSTVPALHALAEPDHNRLHVFGGSPVLHQEVYHALRFDHQVAPEEKYAEDDGERQNAQHRDLHHTHDEEFAFVLDMHQGASAVAGHHVVGAIAGVWRQSPSEGLTPVKQRALGHIEERDVHVS